MGICSRLHWVWSYCGGELDYCTSKKQKVTHAAYNIIRALLYAYYNDQSLSGHHLIQP